MSSPVGLPVEISMSAKLLTAVGFMILILALFIKPIYYQAYELPIINAKIDLQCKSQGYDTWKSWEGVGLFPTEATYVICKFVDNRQDIQGKLMINME